MARTTRVWVNLAVIIDQMAGTARTQKHAEFVLGTLPHNCKAAKEFAPDDPRLVINYRKAI